MVSVTSIRFRVNANSRYRMHVERAIAHKGVINGGQKKRSESTKSNKLDHEIKSRRSFAGSTNGKRSKTAISNEESNTQKKTCAEQRNQIKANGSSHIFITNDLARNQRVPAIEPNSHPGRRSRHTHTLTHTPTAQDTHTTKSFIRPNDR